MNRRLGRSPGRRHGPGPLAICAILATAWAAAAAPAEGQRLRGRLVDLDSDQPLVSGLLTLRSEDGSPIATAFSDGRGRWAFDIPGPGTYYVEARRLDYQKWVAGPIQIAEEDDLESVFQLQRRPIELDPIEVSVTATRLHLERSGFYERQRSDFGHFMTYEDIEKRHATRITEVLMRVPGVRLVSMSTGSTGGRYVALRGSNLSDGSNCRPRVFVDGLLYALGDSRPRPRFEEDATEFQTDMEEMVDQGLSLDDIGPPGDIAGIEVYRSASQVPVQFGGTSVETLCGVIVIWTRRGSPRPSR